MDTHSLDPIPFAGDRYEVERTIGSGGMATVYLAWDRRYDRKVAIKVLADHLTSAIGAQRFHREIGIIARFQHPHIVPLYDSGEVEGRLYYVMPYVEGESLRERLEREGPLPVSEAVAVARQIAAALSYAHEHDVVHRDVKPGNVLLSSGEAVVADFGIARGTGSGGSSRLTKTGVTSGSPGYMSPEQWADESVDHRADVYALGCVLYEMLTGSPPYAAGNPRAAMLRQASGPPEGIRQIRSTVPPGLEQTVFRALAPEPADRFPTARAFADALVPFEAEPTAGSAGRSAPRIRRAMPLQIALAGIVLAVLSVLFIARRGAGIDFEQRDWILIADVENNTGNEIFDRTLHHALTVALDQSLFVNVFPRNRVNEVLARMRRDPGERIDEPVALEVAQREPIKIVLLPAISGLGDRYLISTRLVDPVRGVTVGSHRAEVEGREQILEALDELARGVRRSLGESLAGIRERSVPLPRATTHSLEALKLYVDGSRAWGENRPEEARGLWSRAADLDSTFAWAHASLGLVTSWLEGPEAAQRHIERARRHLDRVTEKERLWILGLVGEGEEALEAYQSYVRLYPDDRDGWYNLGNTLRTLQRLEEAQQAYERSLAIDSSLSWAYTNLGSGYDLLGKVEEAHRAFERAMAMDSSLARTWRGDVNRMTGFVMVKVGDTARARMHFELLLDGGPEARANGLRSTALLQMYRGAHDTAIALFREAIVLNQQTGAALSEYRNRMYIAQAYSTKGREGPFNTELDIGADLQRVHAFDPFWSFFLARHLVSVGRVAEAESILDAWLRDGAAEGGDRWLAEALRGIIALARDRPSDAVAALEVALQLRRDGLVLEALAAAYEANGEIEAAAKTYEALIDLVPLGLEPQDGWVMAHYRAAILHEQAGRPDLARPLYDRFLQLWGQGDPDLPGVATATRRLDALGLGPSPAP